LLQKIWHHLEDQMGISYNDRQRFRMKMSIKLLLSELH